MPPCSSPLASRCQVPTFCTAAWSPAHAACMPATVWAKHRLLPDSVPGLLMGPGFDGFYHWISAPDRRFTFVRLLGPHLTSSPLAFSTDAHHASYHPRAALGGLKPGPATRLRGALPHRLYSLLSQGFRLISASWRTRAPQSVRPGTPLSNLPGTAIGEWHPAGKQSLAGLHMPVRFRIGLLHRPAAPSSEAVTS